MEWHIRSDAPVYAQLVRQMERGIASGNFAPGERLPSVRDMAAEAGVNPNTMQRALQELERNGLVYTMRTSGRFVTEDAGAISLTRQQLARTQTMDYLQAMQELGYPPAEASALIMNLLKADIPPATQGKETRE